MRASLSKLKEGLISTQEVVFTSNLLVINSRLDVLGELREGPRSSIATQTTLLNRLQNQNQIQTEVSGVRCQVPGARCQVPGARCQVSGARCQVSGVRCQVSGVRCQVSVSNARFPVSLSSFKEEQAGIVTHSPSCLYPVRHVFLPSYAGGNCRPVHPNNTLTIGFYKFL